MTLNDASRTIPTHRQRDSPPTAELVEATLEGAPAGFPAELCRQRVAPADESLKIASYGGYEHFERDRTASGPPVFRWVGRTVVAE